MMLKKLSLYRKVLVGLILFSLIFIVGKLFMMHRVVLAFEQRFPMGTYINTCNVSGLTQAEALHTLQIYLQEQVNQQKVIFQADEVIVDLPLEAFQPLFETEAVVAQAFETSHQGTWREHYQQAHLTDVKPLYFTLKPSYSKEVLSHTLQSYQDKFYLAPRDATISRISRAFHIEPEQIGHALDVDGTVSRLYTLLQTQQATYIVEAALTPLLPAQTTETLQLIQSPIASFSTAYNDVDANRNQNLSVASSKINCVLAPDEIFSLGNQLEPITFEEGYRSSKVILNGKLEEGIGGGVCQIASTLYNAVLLTDLEIITRANHSLPVSYVPLGRDATYASGSIDFKFQNTSPYPIFVESYCESNRVYVNLFSHASLKPHYTQIKFSSDVVNVEPPPTPLYLKDPKLEIGQMITETPALEGKTVKLYKLFYENGVLMNKVLVNTSYYHPRAAVVRIGTQAVTLE